jgi:hypothetical protein
MSQFLAILANANRNRAQHTKTKPPTMNLTVKTLKGGKFTVEVDPSNTVAQVKVVIVRVIVVPVAFIFVARYFIV